MLEYDQRGLAVSIRFAYAGFTVKGKPRSPLGWSTHARLDESLRVFNLIFADHRRNRIMHLQNKTISFVYLNHLVLDYNGSECLTDVFNYFAPVYTAGASSCVVYEFYAFLGLVET
jgi:hypothetical protein